MLILRQGWTSGVRSWSFVARSNVHWIALWEMDKSVVWVTYSPQVFLKCFVINIFASRFSRFICLGFLCVIIVLSCLVSLFVKHYIFMPILLPLQFVVFVLFCLIRFGLLVFAIYYLLFINGDADVAPNIITLSTVFTFNFFGDFDR